MTAADEDRTSSRFTPVTADAALMRRLVEQVLTDEQSGWALPFVTTLTTAIERLGARFDGILRAHMPGTDGTVRDTAYYSILREEWPDVEANLRARLAR